VGHEERARVLGRPEDHLYGCAVMLAAAPLAAGRGPGQPAEGAAGGKVAAATTTTYLFTWSEDEFASLLDVLYEWLGPPARAATAAAAAGGGGGSNGGSLRRPAPAERLRPTEEWRQRSGRRRARCVGPARPCIRSC
jgi:hypothetical protein